MSSNWTNSPSHGYYSRCFLPSFLTSPLPPSLSPSFSFPLQIIRLITKETIEEHTLQRSLEKKKLSDQVMEEGEEEEGDPFGEEEGGRGKKGGKGKGGEGSLKDAQLLLARALFSSSNSRRKRKRGN